MLAIAGVCVLLIALVGGLAYWLNVRHFESTDDAFVAARSFSVAPKVGGYVVTVAVTDNQHVNSGDVLARIDDRDYRIAVDQAQAQVAVADANIANIQAQLDSQGEQINQAKAQEQQAEAQLQFAQEARQHRTGIAGVIAHGCASRLASTASCSGAPQGYRI
jgi:membrane fusion protein (multidrug efflux system)